MKTVIFLALCTLVTTALAQLNSTFFRAQFGAPTEESFRVAPNIHMTASYAGNGEVCAVTLGADTPTRNSDSAVMSQALEDALEKAIPVSLWGAKTDFEMTTMTGCLGSTMTRYENVDISRTVFSSVRNMNGTCTTQMQVQVRFTHNPCASAQSGAVQ